MFDDKLDKKRDLLIFYKLVYNKKKMNELLIQEQ